MRCCTQPKSLLACLNTLSGVACINTGRNFIGFELDEHYFGVASDRINKAKHEHETRNYPSLWYWFGGCCQRLHRLPCHAIWLIQAQKPMPIKGVGYLGHTVLMKQMGKRSVWKMSNLPAYKVSWQTRPWLMMSSMVCVCLASKRPCQC